MAKKFDKNNYRFIDLAETDHTQFSQLELDKMIEDTKEVLEMTKKELTDYVKKLEKEMKQAASDLQFERAAQLRDMVFEYKAKL